MLLLVLLLYNIIVIININDTITITDIITSTTIICCLSSQQSKNSPEETPNPRRESKRAGRQYTSKTIIHRPVFLESPLGFGVSSGEFVYIDSIHKTSG